MRTLLLLFLFTSILSSQEIDFKRLSKLAPRNIGPSGMSGRVTSIDVNLMNKQEIYVGTASGGLWKSTSGGIDWFPIFDSVDVQSIGAVKVQENNPDVVWVGTGEGNPRNSLNSGKGIFKSLDGGKTWQFKGLKNSSNIHRIVINRENPDIVFLGVIGNPWADSQERGVFKTTDGGETWQKSLYIDEKTGCADLVIDPINPNKMFATMWEHRRNPYFFKSGGKGSGIYVTYDAGKHWKKVSEGLPKGELGRIGVAISKSKSNIVYATIESEKNAFYKSIDGGESWKFVTDKGFGDRPFYYSEIYVDPKNENRIYTLFSLVSRSEDGGKTWDVVLPYYGVHPDHHAFWIDPENPNFLIDGNDGGLNFSYDMGKNWRFVENLPVAQFYHINVDNQIPYNVYGGMQDNGSWIGPSRVWRVGGIRNSYWQELVFGDGFDVIPDASNPRYGYAMWQEGRLQRYDLETGKLNYVKPAEFDSIPLRFNWNSALAQDPFDNSVYFGSQFLHKSTDNGASWITISPDLTTNDTTKQKQAESGGLTADATGAENYTTILAIAPSKLEKGVIWVGTDDGNIQLTTDGGKSWENTAKSIPVYSKHLWIPYILPSKYNKNEAFVVANNYRQGDMTAYLYYTTNMGKSWSNILEGKGIDSYIHSFWQDEKSPNLYFLGTENGLYISLDRGSKWQKWNEKYPSVPTIDFAYNENYNDLVIGTFGRAAWIFDNIAPFQELAKNKQILNDTLKVFDVQDAYLVTFRRNLGERFDADATYKGANISANARIAFYINNQNKDSAKVDKNKKEKHKDEKLQKDENVDPFKLKKDEASIKIFNQKMEEIRELRVKVSDGINVVEWGLDAKKLRYPNQNKPEKFFENGGRPIKPGKYNIIVEYDNHKDTTEVVVKYDPRNKFDEQIFTSLSAKLDSLYQVVEVATNIADNFRDVREAVEIIKKKYSIAVDSVKKKVNRLSDSLISKLDVAQEILYGKKIKKQGINRNIQNLIEDISTTEQYINSSDALPGSNIDLMLNSCRNQLDELILNHNKFINNDYKEFKKEILNLELDILKEIEIIKK